MQRIGEPEHGRTSQQPIVWQAYITGHIAYYGEKFCCEDWYPFTYLYKWVEVHGRFSSVTPAWNPRLSFPDPHVPGTTQCFTEQAGLFDPFNVGALSTGDELQHGSLAVNTAEFTYRPRIRQFLFTPIDDAPTCTIVLMSLGWFDDLERCANEPRIPRLRPFFHQFRYLRLYDQCPE
jgi:hypothetical protein